MEAKTLIIHNPLAGKRKKIDLQQKLSNLLPSNLNYDYVETEYAKHGTEITKEGVKKGYDRIIVAGGDGSVNETAKVLVNTNVSLGIIPMGSGNGLARHMGIPLKIDDAIAHLLQPSTNAKTIDVGLIDDHHFFCAAGVGFDAYVSEKFSHSKTRGFMSYISIACKAFLNYQPKKYQVRIDNKEIEEEAFLLTFANAAQYGNNAFIAPQAKIDNGELEVCILKPFPWYYSLSLTKRLFSRTIDRSRYYTSYRGKGITLKKEGKITFHCDGEVFQSNKETISISVIPQALNILVP